MSEDGTEPESADLALKRRVRRAILTIAAVLVAYYAVPVGEIPSTAGVALSVLGLIAGLGLLVHQTVRQVRRLAGARPDDGVVRIESLIFLIYFVVPLFALGYFALESADPSQFAELTTKTDALYFTVSARWSPCSPPSSASAPPHCASVRPTARPRKPSPRPGTPPATEARTRGAGAR